jgi:hypothetical protein
LRIALNRRALEKFGRPGAHTDRLTDGDVDGRRLPWREGLRRGNGTSRHDERRAYPDDDDTCRRPENPAEQAL